jgi:ketosteroid isomerase-like protein
MLRRQDGVLQRAGITMSSAVPGGDGVPASSIEVVLEFEQLINSHNAEAVCGLCTADSVFIDSLGNRMEGAQKLRAAWEGYFKMVPDYTISHSEVFANGDTVAMFGSAQGTFSKNGQLRNEDFWKTPAGWRAVVKDGKIAVWQVFADNEPIRAVMRKY